MTTIEFKIVSIDKIIEPEWDIRKDKDDDSDNSNFNSLVQSIKTSGVIQPITVTKTKSEGQYEIIVGRRRFKACKMLNLNEIPAVIRSETADKGDKQRIALIENLHRKDLSDIEKAEGILSVYTNAEYKPHNVIRFIKSLENRGYQPGTTDRNLILSVGKHYLNKTDTNNNNSKSEPIISEKFLDIVDSIGYSPITQYKYLQIVVKLEPSILKKAEAKGLSINKKNMLINKQLNKHPNLQKNIIDKIADKPEKEARIIVAQTIRDIETGALVKSGSSFVIDYNSREKIDTKVEREKFPIEHYLDFLKAIESVMHIGTGHKLTEEEFSYEPNHIQYSENHRIKILSDMSTNQLYQLEQDIEVAKDLLESWEHLIGDELVKRGEIAPDHSQDIER